MTIRLKLQSLVLLILLPALLLINLVTGMLLYSDLKSNVMAGFDQKLRAVSSVTGAFIDGDRHARLLGPGIRESEPDYQRYALPMRVILKKEEVAFLYTMVLIEGGRRLRFVIDPSQDASHVKIGTIDPVPPSDISGNLEANSLGTLFVSAIRPWEQWGVLKTGVAPIFNAEGEIKALVGVDIEASSIEEKTHRALRLVFLSCSISLFLGSLVAFFISRKLIRPIAQLNDAALRVAAGQYDQRALPKSPRELAELSRDFERMSLTLERAVLEQAEDQQQIESRRCRQELLKSLARFNEGTAPSEKLAAYRDDPCEADPSGWIYLGEKMLVWLADPLHDALQAVRARADLSLIIERLALQENEPLLPRLKSLFPEIRCFALLDPESGALDMFVQKSTSLSLFDKNESFVLAIEKDTQLILLPGQSCRLSSRSEILDTANFVCMKHQGSVSIPQHERNGEIQPISVRPEVSKGTPSLSCANEICDNLEKPEKFPIEGMIALMRLPEEGYS